MSSKLKQRPEAELFLLDQISQELGNEDAQGEYVGQRVYVMDLDVFGPVDRIELENGCWVWPFRGGVGGGVFVWEPRGVSDGCSH